jgi:hypothetical protein
VSAEGGIGHYFEARPGGEGWSFSRIILFILGQFVRAARAERPRLPRRPPAGSGRPLRVLPFSKPQFAFVEDAGSARGWRRGIENWRVRCVARSARDRTETTASCHFSNWSASVEIFILIRVLFSCLSSQFSQRALSGLRGNAYWNGQILAAVSIAEWKILNDYRPC